MTALRLHSLTASSSKIVIQLTFSYYPPRSVQCRYPNWDGKKIPWVYLSTGSVPRNKHDSWNDRPGCAKLTSTVN